MSGVAAWSMRLFQWSRRLKQALIAGMNGVIATAEGYRIDEPALI